MTSTMALDFPTFPGSFPSDTPDTPTLPGSFPSDTLHSSPQDAKHAKDHLVVAIMGATGSGKSTLINFLAGEDVTIGHGLRSCTTDIKEFRCRVNNKDVYLLDTPGFNDSDQDGKADIDILESLAEWMQGAAEDGLHLSGIIYLHSISDARMTGSSVANLEMFKALCGESNLKNVILATTKWGITPAEDALRRESELKDPDGFWKIYIANQAQIRRFEHSVQSATSLIEEIFQIGKTTFVPQFQREVEEGRPIGDTRAGSLLRQRIARLTKKHMRDLAAARREYELAKKNRDETYQKIIIEMQQKLEMKNRQREQELQQLRENENVRYQRRLDFMQSLHEEHRRIHREREEERYRQGRRDQADRFHGQILQKKEEKEQREWEEEHDERKSEYIHFRSTSPASSIGPQKEYINQRKFYQHLWRCLRCRRQKTATSGKWKCPDCDIWHSNKW